MKWLSAFFALCLTSCATCNVTPALAPACPQDLPCVRTDKGAILYLECNDEVPGRN